MGGQIHQHLDPAPAEPGLYRTVTGAEAISLGLVAGAKLAGLPMFFGGYPITPASAILHHLSRLKEYGVTTFQAEDEIAAIGARSARASPARSASPPPPAPASRSRPRRWASRS
jgi:2-oxoglutarate ferredoxin oxidoreductase subunit alpha